MLIRAILTNLFIFVVLPLSLFYLPADFPLFQLGSSLSLFPSSNFLTLQTIHIPHSLSIFLFLPWAFTILLLMANCIPTSLDSFRGVSSMHCIISLLFCQNKFIYKFVVTVCSTNRWLSNCTLKKNALWLALSAVY